MPGKQSDNPNEFLLPDLGEGLEEAELLEWCVKPGQKVNEFDILAKMETDKALVEVPSPRDGTIERLHGQPGQFIKVGTVLVTYAPDNGDVASSHRQSSALPAPVEQEVNHDEDAGTVVGTLNAAPGISSEPGKVRAAPAVRQAARATWVSISSRCAAAASLDA